MVEATRSCTGPAGGRQNPFHSWQGPSRYPRPRRLRCAQQTFLRPPRDPAARSVRRRCDGFGCTWISVGMSAYFPTDSSPKVDTDQNGPIRGTPRPSKSSSGSISWSRQEVDPSGSDWLYFVFSSLRTRSKRSAHSRAHDVHCCSVTSTPPRRPAVESPPIPLPDGRVRLARQTSRGDLVQVRYPVPRKVHHRRRGGLPWQRSSWAWCWAPTSARVP